MSVPAEINRHSPFKKPLVDIDITNPKSDYWNFYGIERLQDKIVRVRRGIEEDIERYAKGKLHFDELRDNYGIHVPRMQTIAVKAKRWDVLFYTVTDRVYGTNLQTFSPATQVTKDKLDQCFASLAQRFIDVEQNGGTYLIDFSNPWEMFMYGRREGETEDNVYLVDIDPSIAVHEKDDDSQFDLLQTVKLFYLRSYIASSSYPLARAKIVEYLQSVEPKSDLNRRLLEDLKVIVISSS